MKEEKREKVKPSSKPLRDIPLSKESSSLTKSNVLKKKNSNSLSSNNDIFLKSNLGFQKSKTNGDIKNLTSNSLNRTKQSPQIIDYFTPKEIIEKFSKYLNPFEQEEIFLFQEIYYCGKFLKNKQQMIKIESNSNLGSSLVRNNTSTNEDDKNINLK